jgi:hypothetical protein
VFFERGVGMLLDERAESRAVGIVQGARAMGMGLDGFQTARLLAVLQQSHDERQRHGEPLGDLALRPLLVIDGRSHAFA